VLAEPGWEKDQDKKRIKNWRRKLLCYCKASTGEAGVFVKDLRSGRIASIHADTLFPTASMVKIPILIGIMNKIDAENCNITSR